MTVPNNVTGTASTLLFCLLFGLPAAAVSGPAVTAAPLDGVRHSVEVSIAAESDNEAPVRGSLGLSMHIASFTKQADFSKTLTVIFENADLGGGSPQKVWEEPSCHERRGYPRIWLDELRGTVTRGGEKIDVVAIPRHLGQLLPKDELRVGQPVSANGDDFHQERVYRSRTVGSRLMVDVKLTSIACRL